MKLSLFISVSVIAAAAVFNVQAGENNSGLKQGPGAEELSKEIARRTEKIDDVAFNFTQQVFIAGSTDTVRAEVFHKRPHYFRVNYTQPVVQEIYFDGSELITYIPRIRQATSQKTDFAEDMLGVSTSLIFSREGLEALEKDHRIHIAGVEPDTADIVLEAFPLNREDYEKIIIIFDSQSLRPLRARVWAPHAESLTLFTDYRINPGLEEELFIFEKPEEVDLMRINGR